jgi:amino acid transporter
VEPTLRKELGLFDLVLAQILCVVGSAWVGVAARLGRAHLVFWVAAMLLFYLPLAAVVVHLSRRMPVEGGLYRWATAGFGEMPGFLVAWNLWVYAVAATGSILFVIPTDLTYLFGPRWTWLAKTPWATLALIGSVMIAITFIALRGLDIGKWLHNAGSIMILLAYAILLALPWWALARGAIPKFEPFPIALPRMNWFALAIFGQMAVGALSGFEYVGILAGECRSASRTIGQSVIISAPIIAAMFILGTSTVLTFIGGQPINIIGPIPQTFRSALGAAGPAAWAAQFGILLLLARAVASASLLFTGITRLPLTAAWDNIAPPWFTRLHPTRKTPVNSILFVAVLVMAFIAFSLMGVGEQESAQLLVAASVVHYAIAYAALFALPLFGALRDGAPAWLKPVAVAGLLSSLISLGISIYPVIDVVSRAAYAAKITAVVLVTNLLGVLLYRTRRAVQ